jgi:S1-C subfamily serine protease
MKQCIASLQTKARRLWSRTGLLLLAVIIAVPLVLAGCTAAASTPVTTPNSNAITSNTAVTSPLYDEGTVVSLYDKAIPAIVEIDTTVKNSNFSINPFNPFSNNSPTEQGIGSGFFIDKEGHILTNNHVIDNATSVKVVLYDGTTVEGKVVGRDRQNDLAIVSIDTGKVNSISYLTLGNSDAIKPGQMAVALGSPFGLSGSVTVGIVSGTGRTLPSDNRRAISNVIQTDAAINPGNSGGPLLNSKGEVIGINTAIEASGSGIGFAVPINTAKKVLPAMLKGGDVKTSWLGITGMEITQDLAKTLSLPVDKGVYVLEATSGGPADKAGIKGSGYDNQNQPKSGGDIITKVDNVTVAKVPDMTGYFNGKQPGDKITLSIYRDGKQQNVDVTLGEWPSTTVRQSSQQQPQQQQPGFNFGPFQWNFEFPSR